MAGRELRKDVIPKQVLDRETVHRERELQSSEEEVTGEARPRGGRCLGAGRVGQEGRYGLKSSV